MIFTETGHKIDITINDVYVAGWTGRNRESVENHIQELAELGISPPSKIPLYYRISNEWLTRKSRIQVLGNETSGEIEPLLIRQDGKTWLGLASDHTDRQLEAYSVAASKQACPKPISSELWSFDSVKDHMDALILKCRILESGQWIDYQSGEMARILPITDLICESEIGNHSAMLCGTLTAIGGVRPAMEYSMELIDPVLDRTISLEYSVNTLPLIE
ncbi:MAG: DUF2848 domain-containing protein [Granulosicoccus sp.]